MKKAENFLYYKVEENHLRKLTMDKQEITENAQTIYVLNKGIRSKQILLSIENKFNIFYVYISRYKLKNRATYDL